MRRGVVALLAFALVALSACSPLNQDQKALARTLATSKNLARTFVYKALEPTAFFEVEGRVLDDFRYELTLAAHGVPLLDEIVSDDALAVRLLDPNFGKALSNTLGHPTVDKALRAGQWVIDPSGAPALINPSTAEDAETTGDPLRDAREALLYASTSMNQASQVRKFSLEDIAYRPLFDPWRYPDKSEIRYDLVRPALPKSAGAGSGGQSEGITPASFRKLSVFVTHRRVETTCEFVDIEGHEDFVALRQRGLGSNPYQRDLLRRIEKKQTAFAIEPKVAVLDLSYPDSVDIAVPKGAVTGKLEAFTSAFLQGVKNGALRPEEGDQLEDCRRRAKTF